MIAVMLGVLITISSLMLAFFLAVANVSYIVETDFMSKAKKNAVMHSFYVAQLQYRAKNFVAPAASHPPKKLDTTAGYLRKNGNGPYNNLTYNITIDSHENIKSEVKIK